MPVFVDALNVAARDVRLDEMFERGAFVRVVTFWRGDTVLFAALRDIVFFVSF